MPKGTRYMVQWKRNSTCTYWIPMFDGAKLRGLMEAKTGVMPYDKTGYPDKCVWFLWQPLVDAKTLIDDLSAQIK